MAPRELVKEAPKVQRTIIKVNSRKVSQTTTTTGLSSKVSVIKKTMTTTKSVEQTPLKANKQADTRQRDISVPTYSTPKAKENKFAAAPGSVTKSGKKSWKRRPKPAHSGVPVPEKMKRILEKQLQDSDCTL